ncbi:hypothetical protein BH10PLA2_BH10PLA2_08880 [soil metagenome]
MESEPLAPEKEVPEDILADWLESAEGGKIPDPHAFLENHPEHADALKPYLEEWRQFKSIAGPMSGLFKPQLRNSTSLAAGRNADSTPTNPASVDLPTHLLPLLADYEIRGELGRGGMGIVYRARQKSLDRSVALKVLRTVGMGTSADAERFRNEAVFVAQLDHPHIVPIYEVGEQNGSLYYSMKLIEGGSLRDHLARFQNEPRKAGQLVATVARAVQHAHQYGILHRDLKPSNILLDGDDQPHVTDFGLAKRLENDSELTQSGDLLGTPSYMAPEQATGKLASATIATDVYGLGSVLYALLTGCPPFRADSVLGTLDLVRQGTPDPPSSRNKRVDRDLQTICLKCLEKEPRQRYTTAEALANDLERWLRDEPIRARPAQGWERLRKWARRRPTTAALALVSAATVIAVIVGVGLFNFHLSQALDTSDRLRADGLIRESSMRRVLYVADMRDARHSWENGNDARALEILQRYVPQEAEEDLRGWEWHYLDNCCHGELQHLQGHAAPILSMTVSPDERLLATSDKSGVIKAWSLPAMRELKRIQYAAKEVNCVAFSPDGRTLATTGQDRFIHLWETTGWTEIKKLQGHNGTILAIAFSPDGTRLVSAARDARIMVHDVAAGRASHSWAAGASLTSVVWSADGRSIASTGDDNMVKLWEASTGQSIGRMGPRDEKDLCLQFAPDGTWLAAGGYGEELHVWDLKTQTLASTVHCRGSIRDLALDPSARLLAAADRAGSLSLWQFAGRRGELRLLRRHLANKSGLRAVRFLNRGQSFITASEDGAIQSWDLTAVAGRQTFSLTQLVVDLSTDQRLALRASADGTTSLWDLERGESQCSLTSHTGAVKNGDFSARGGLVATAGADKQILVSDVSTGKLVARIPAKSPIPCRVALSPDGALLANAGANHSVEVWDVRSGKIRCVLEGHSEPCHVVLFSPDGRTLASADGVGTIRLWDWRAGSCRAILSHGGEWVNSLAFSADGLVLATGGLLPIIKTWDVDSGKQLAAFSGHSARIMSLAFSPDGKTLISTSKDRTAKLWHLPTCQELFTLVQHAAGLWSIAFTSEGELSVATTPDALGIAEVFRFSGKARPLEARSHSP